MFSKMKIICNFCIRARNMKSLRIICFCGPHKICIQKASFEVFKLVPAWDWLIRCWAWQMIAFADTAVSVVVQFMAWPPFFFKVRVTQRKSFFIGSCCEILRSFAVPSAPKPKALTPIGLSVGVPIWVNKLLTCLFHSCCWSAVFSYVSGFVHRCSFLLFLSRSMSL